MIRRKQFIAGAICPACDQADKLFVYRDDEYRVCECSACGFRDERKGDAEPGTAEYKRGLGDNSVQVVKLLDPGAS